MPSPSKHSAAAAAKTGTPASSLAGRLPGLRRPGPALPHRPIHPGRFLQTRFLSPLGMSQVELAAALGVSRRRINELLRGHRAITADTALRLAALFGVDPHFWLGLQATWDLHLAEQARTPEKIDLGQ